MTLPLLCAFVAAKLLSLPGGLVWSGPGLLAYVWQDIAVAIVAGLALDRIRTARLRILLGATIVFYAAVNVPLARIVASPFTWPMWRAAAGPLADSIAETLTLANLVRMAAVIAAAGAGLIAARACRQYASTRLRLAALAAAVALAALGPAADARVDTAGRHRNALAALWPRAALPVSLAAMPPASDVRASWAEPAPDLSNLRGAARGFNVLVVILESTAAQYLGLYGASPDPMPRLSALAAHALVFDDAYTIYPESIRSLYAVLCARDPAIDAPPEHFAAAHCPALPETFARHGYRTGLFHSGRFGYLGMDAVIRNRGFHTLEDAGAIGGRVESSFGVDEMSTANRLLGWVDQRGGAPFFAMYLPAAGHHPYGTAVPGPFGAATDFDRYRNALHETDAALGAVMDGLRDRGLESRTLVVVFGDHGEAFGQHAGNFAHASFLFDENVRVPYLVSLPGALSPARRIDAVASLVDTAPTILALTGLAEPQPAGTASPAGHSLLDPAPHAALFFTDYTSRQVGVRDGCWKTLLDLDEDRSHVFDVCHDPLERDDRARRDAERTARDLDRLRTWSAIGLRSPAEPVR